LRPVSTEQRGENPLKGGSLGGRHEKKGEGVKGKEGIGSQPKGTMTLIKGARLARRKGVSGRQGHYKGGLTEKGRNRRVVGGMGSTNRKKL